MPPRPIHLWKSFWLGILVLIFLGWAWVRSMSHMDIAAWIYTSGTQGIFVRSTDARLHWFATGPGHSISPTTPHFQVYTYGSGPAENWFPRFITFEPFEDKGGWTLYLAHWFIILLFLIPWTAFLIWRWQRMKRHVAGSAEPPARSST